MINKEIIPDVIRPKRKHMIEYKSPYYALFFAKLKQYIAEKKLRKNFADADLRFLIKGDIKIQENYKASNVNSFLNFCCREDIGICKQKFVKRHGGRYEKFSIIDLAKYENLSDYLTARNINYIQIKDEVDKRTLEEKL